MIPVTAHSLLSRSALFVTLLFAPLATGSAESLSGVIRIDGSSTVFPITEAITEEFNAVQPKVRIPVGVSGTGGGFKKFCAKEVEMASASRPVKAEEAAACRSAGVEFIEVPIAFDALTVVVNPRNDWASSMTVEELKKLWEPAAQGKIMKWSEVRAGWPESRMRLFGPGTDSGTFDYFTEAAVGKEDSSRGDYTSSEDDNIIVQGVATDKDALGYLGMSYYEENAKKLKAVGIDDGKDENGKGPVTPSSDTVRSGTYQPLARPLFIYIAKSALERPEVKAFVDYYFENAPLFTKEVGYVPLSDEAYALAKARVASGKVGSMFEGAKSSVGVKVEELLKR